MYSPSLGRDRIIGGMGATGPPGVEAGAGAQPGSHGAGRRSGVQADVRAGGRVLNNSRWRRNAVQA